MAKRFWYPFLSNGQGNKRLTHESIFLLTLILCRLFWSPDRRLQHLKKPSDFYCERNIIATSVSWEAIMLTRPGQMLGCFTGSMPPYTICYFSASSLLFLLSSRKVSWYTCNVYKRRQRFSIYFQYPRSPRYDLYQHSLILVRPLLFARASSLTTTPASSSEHHFEHWSWSIGSPFFKTIFFSG